MYRFFRFHPYRYVISVDLVAGLCCIRLGLSTLLDTLGIAAVTGSFAMLGGVLLLITVYWLLKSGEREMIAAMLERLSDGDARTVGTAGQANTAGGWGVKP